MNWDWLFIKDEKGNPLWQVLLILLCASIVFGCIIWMDRLQPTRALSFTTNAHALWGHVHYDRLEDDEETTCVVCYARRAVICSPTCVHGENVCITCASALVDQEGIYRCPLCMAYMTTVMIHRPPSTTYWLNVATDPEDWLPPASCNWSSVALHKEQQDDMVDHVG